MRTSLLKLIRVFQTLSRLFQFAENVKCGRISQRVVYWGPQSSLERQRKIHRRLFTLSIKSAINALGFSRRSRAVTAKKCTEKRVHVKSCCFS